MLLSPLSGTFVLLGVIYHFLVFELKLCLGDETGKLIRHSFGIMEWELCSNLDIDSLLVHLSPLLLSSIDL